MANLSLRDLNRAMEFNDVLIEARKSALAAVTLYEVPPDDERAHILFREKTARIREQRDALTFLYEAQRLLRSYRYRLTISALKT